MQINPHRACILFCMIPLFVACGGGDGSGSLDPIGGIYKTESHLVNPTNCSQDGTNHADTPMGGALVWHDAYFKMIEGFMPDSWELEWCPSADATDCRFSLLSVEETSSGWYSEHVQAGGQAGFDCENLRNTYSAEVLDDGRLRLEYRNFVQSVPEGSSECSLAAARALEGNEYCRGYEVIIGSPVP